MAATEPVFVNSEYGKNYVRLLYVAREGALHHMREIEVRSKEIIKRKPRKNTLVAPSMLNGIYLNERFNVI